jgi:ribose transport system ATP-binding protein
VNTDIVLAVRGLSKAYAAPVLVGADLDVRAGEVHALMGANGAGKSTLVRIACGLTPADAGTMTLAGTPYAPASRRAADDAGVQVVLQELNLVASLSVAENLFLARFPHRFGVIDRATLHTRARQALDAVGLGDLDPRTPVHRLGVGQQQLVASAACSCSTSRRRRSARPRSAGCSGTSDAFASRVSASSTSRIASTRSHASPIA